MKLTFHGYDIMSSFHNRFESLESPPRQNFQEEIIYLFH